MTQATSQLTWEDLEPRYRTLLEREISVETVQAWLTAWSDLEKDVGEAFSAAHRAKDEDTRDAAAEKTFLYFTEVVAPKVEEVGQRLRQKLLALEGYTPPSELEQLLRRFRNAAALYRETNVPLSARINALANEYNKLTGAVTVSWEGEETTLPELQRKLREPNRDVRERAWRVVADALGEVAPQLDEVFLKLLKLRRQLAANAGLSDYRAYRWLELDRFDYSFEESLTLVDSIEKEVVPLLEDIWAKRRERLGVTSLRPWDLQVDPDKRPPLAPFESIETFEDKLEHIFGRLDPALGEQFALLRDGWLDLAPRPGKVPNIGYTSYFPKSNRPYIYYNAAGTHTDVWVMLHEMGHAFHALAAGSAQDLVWNQFYAGGMEFVELPSQAMELLALPYLAKKEGGFYTGDEMKRAEEEQYVRTLQLFGVARGEAFQHWLYAEAPEDVTVEQIDAKWLELDERFAPWVDWSGLKHRRAKGWQNAHLFMQPFYMLEYAMAYLGAIEVWRDSLGDREEALNKYRAALSLGATKTVPELFEAIGATFTFDRETVREQAGLIAARLEAVQ